MSDLPQINPKLKTSLTYEIDTNAEQSPAPAELKSAVIVQMLTDKREKVNKSQSAAVDSKLVLFLTQEHVDKKNHLALDQKYRLTVWNTNNKADKWNMWTKTMDFSTEAAIHQVDFIDLRSETPEVPNHDFLIYGIFRRSSGSAE